MKWLQNKLDEMYVLSKSNGERECNLYVLFNALNEYPGLLEITNLVNGKEHDKKETKKKCMNTKVGREEEKDLSQFLFL